MPILQDSNGSNYHNHIQKPASRFFNEVEDNMTFSCIKQSFVVVSSYTASNAFYLFPAHRSVATDW